MVVRRSTGCVFLSMTLVSRECSSSALCRVYLRVNYRRKLWLWSCTDAKLCNISIYLYDFANCDEADAGELLVALFLCCP